MKLHQQIIQLLHLKNGFQMILPFPMRCLYHSAGEEKNQSMKYRAAGPGSAQGGEIAPAGRQKCNGCIRPGGEAIQLAGYFSHL